MCGSVKRSVHYTFSSHLGLIRSDCQSLHSASHSNVHREYGDIQKIILPQKSVMQVGPRMSFQSAWSTNAVSICRSCGLEAVTRLEVSRRFLLRSSSAISPDTLAAFSAMVSLLRNPSRPFCRQAAMRLTLRTELVTKRLVR